MTWHFVLVNHSYCFNDKQEILILYEKLWSTSKSVTTYLHHLSVNIDNCFQLLIILLTEKSWNSLFLLMHFAKSIFVKLQRLVLLYVFHPCFNYWNFLNVFVASQSDITRRLEKSSHEKNEPDGSPGFLSRSEITHGEHPLSLGQSSIWNQFFQVPLILSKESCITDSDIIFYVSHSYLLEIKLNLPHFYNINGMLPSILTPIFDHLAGIHMLCRMLKSWNKLTEMSTVLIRA